MLPSREQIVECIYWMLIHGSAYGSLHDSSVQDLAKFEIYSSRALARCRQRFGVHPVIAPVRSTEFRLDEDSVINFAQKAYKYVGTDSNIVYLRGDSGKIETFDRDDLQKFFHEGSLQCQRETKQEELTPFARSDNERRDIAIKRAEAMALHEEGVTRLSKSTYYDLRKKRKFGEDTYGCGLSGLLPKVRPGNTKLKTCKDAKELAKEYIRVSYLGLKQDPGSRWKLPVSVSRENRHKKLAWGQYALVAKSYGLTPVSYSTFTRAVNRIRELKKTLAKEGRKAAYQISDMTSGDWSGLTHGLFAGHIVEIDHTLIDLEAIDEDDGVGLGRLWLTVAIDTYSRAILGWYIGFGAPSRVAVMMVVRDMVRRNGSMPLCISVDGGKEFHSVYIDALLAFYRVHKRERPPSRPRYGSDVESLIGTINKDTWHNLLGSTKLMVNVRQVTKEFIAKNRAVWGIREVKEMFEGYVVNYNEKLQHAAIDATPMSFHNKSYSNLLPKQRRVVRFDESFEISCMLAPDRREALTCRRSSLQINNGWYTHPILKEEVNKGRKFVVKWSPWDLRYIYFGHKGEWHKALLGGCHFKQSMSAAEVEILSNEVKARSVGDHKRNTLRIFQGVEFLENYKGKEEDLKMRKARLDREAALGDEVSAHGSDEDLVDAIAAEFDYPDDELPDEPIYSDIFDD